MEKVKRNCHNNVLRVFCSRYIIDRSTLFKLRQIEMSSISIKFSDYETESTWIGHVCSVKLSYNFLFLCISNEAWIFKFSHNFSTAHDIVVVVGSFSTVHTRIDKNRFSIEMRNRSRAPLKSIVLRCKKCIFIPLIIWFFSFTVKKI